MIYENVELHNVAEVCKIPGEGGVRLQRVPESVRAHLEAAKEAMLCPACAEIRFVTGTGSTSRVTLSCPQGQTDVVVFYGLFQNAERFTITREPQTIDLTMPERLQKLDPSFCADMPFSPNVRRLMLVGNPVHYHSVEGAGIRPPRAEELPKLRYLAYGTSITHGACATGPHLTYVAQAARHLGVDLINLGVGGSAFCEPELADYIAARDDRHLATLALSVNMLAHGFALQTFYERASYMINTLAGANTSRPVVCITPYSFFGDLGEQHTLPNQKATPKAFRQALRDAVQSCPHPNVHLLEGTDILADIGGLTPDLVHPADNGMIAMGANLAQRLEPLVEGVSRLGDRIS